MYILAIDSGIEKTGFAVFKDKKYVISALIFTKKTIKTANRLNLIYEKLEKIINKYKPDILVLEKLFFFKNQKTFIEVAQAQGVALVLAGKKNIKVAFLTPLQIKQIVTGYGKADKISVQKMLRLELGIDIKQDDEADAIACGFAYSQLIRANLA